MHDEDTITLTDLRAPLEIPLESNEDFVLGRYEGSAFVDYQDMVRERGTIPANDNLKQALENSLSDVVGQCTSCGQILGAGVTSHNQAECVRNIVRQEIEQYVAREIIQGNGYNTGIVAKDTLLVRKDGTKL